MTTTTRNLGKGKDDKSVGADKRDRNDFAFRRNARGELMLNPTSEAQVDGFRMRHGWERTMLVNADHTMVRLPEMREEEKTINGERRKVWVDTNRKISVMPLQRVRYHCHVMNHDDSPFVICEVPDDSTYTLTTEQAIAHLKRIPDIAFESASKEYRRYANEDRARVLNFIMERLEKLREERIQDEQGRIRKVRIRRR